MENIKIIFFFMKIGCEVIFQSWQSFDEEQIRLYSLSLPLELPCCVHVLLLRQLNLQGQLIYERQIYLVSGNSIRLGTYGEFN